MKSLISRVMYHPFIALSSFYLTDLMCNVDYSLSGALLVLVSESTSRLLSLLSKADRRGDGVASPSIARAKTSVASAQSNEAGRCKSENGYNSVYKQR